MLSVTSREESMCQCFVDKIIRIIFNFEEREISARNENLFGCYL